MLWKRKIENIEGQYRIVHNAGHRGRYDVYKREVTMYLSLRWVYVSEFETLELAREAVCDLQHKMHSGRVVEVYGYDGEIKAQEV